VNFPNHVPLTFPHTATQHLSADCRVTGPGRFETSSTRLDVRVESDIQRLVDMLGQKDFSAREIMLVGYSDSVGPANSNEGLAQVRAHQVLPRIREIVPDGLLDNLTFTTIGRGEVSPIACNDAHDGRFANRRVEIWMRSIGHS